VCMWQVLGLLQSGTVSDATVVQTYGKQIERIKRVSAVMETQALRLDDLVALFSVF
jgi:hypothetical protein